jgi:phospholipase C
MAWCGESKVSRTGTQLLTDEGTLLDWMKSHGVDWRVYHDGLSFFALFSSAWEHLFSDGFRDFERFLSDMQNDPIPPLGHPQVVLVEPSYQNGPHLGSDRPNDNHAPLAVGWGEEFLRRTYEAARSNRKRWESTVLVLTYDEHGGFFDHVPPLDVACATGGAEPRRFTSTGPRVPAVVVSPLVDRGAVCHLPLDHTSVLQLLAEIFTPGVPYSPAVDGRRAQGIGSFSSLIREVPRDDAPPPPSQPIAVSTVLGQTLLEPPAGQDMQSAFELAANELLSKEPVRTAAKYPELQHWKVAVDTARGQRG